MRLLSHSLFNYDFETELSEKLAEHFSSIDEDFAREFLGWLKDSSESTFLDDYGIPGMRVVPEIEGIDLPEDVDKLPLRTAVAGAKNAKKSAKKGGLLGRLNAIKDAVVDAASSRLGLRTYNSFIELLEGERHNLEPFFGDYYDLLLDAIQRLPLFPYERGYYRKAIRSLYASDHTDAIQEVIVNILFLANSDGTLEELLFNNASERLTTWGRCSAGLVSTLIDAGDEEAFTLIREAIASENTRRNLSWDVLRSVFQSKNEELNELVRKLLIAAQRQEGLRQSILETCDQGRREPFVEMLKLIKEQNLIRFASCKRAIATYTGVYQEEDVDRISSKQLDYLIELYTDSDAYKSYISGNDNLKSVLGLFYLGTIDLDLAKAAVTDILDEGKRHSKITAAWFAINFINNSDRAKDWIVQHRDDVRLCAILSKDLLSEFHGFQTLRPYVTLFDNPPALNHFSFAKEYRHWDNSDGKDGDLSHYFDDVDEALVLYEILDSILKETGATSYEFKDTPFPDYTTSVRGDQVFIKMCLIALYVMTHDEAKGVTLLERLQEYVDNIDTYYREGAFYITAWPIRSEKMREFFFNGIASRLDDIRRLTLALLPFVDDMRDEEREFLEACYRYKASTIRQGLTDFFVNHTTEEETLKTISNLLQSKKQDIRLGGLDIIMALRNDPSKHHFYPQAVDLLELIKKPSAKEKVVIEQARAKISQDDLPGYGLFNPNAKEIQFDRPKKNDVPMYSDIIDLDKLKSVVENMITLIEEHQDVEFVGDDGDKLTLASLSDKPFWHIYNREIAKDDEKFKAAIKNDAICHTCILQKPEIWDKFVEENFDEVWIPEFFKNRSKFLKCTSSTDPDAEDEDTGEKATLDLTALRERLFGEEYLAAFEEIKPDEDREFGSYAFEIIDYLSDLFSTRDDAAFLRIENLLIEAYENFEDDELFGSVIDDRAYWTSIETGATFVHCDVLFNLFGQLCGTLSGGKHCVSLGHQALSRFVPLEDLDDETFKRRFIILANYRQRVFSLIAASEEEEEYVVPRSWLAEFSLIDQIRAFNLGLIEEQDLYAALFRDKHPVQQLKSYRVLARLDPAEKRTHWYQVSDRAIGFKAAEDDYYKVASKIYQVIESRTIEAEFTRGDSPTPFTQFIYGVKEINGVDGFVRLITALGKETLERQGFYYSSWYSSQAPSKKDSLSYLIRNSKPNEGDDAEKLAAALKTYEYEPNNKRMVEFGMYSPGWQSIIEAYTGIDGLVEGCLFFRAHNSEIAERYEAEISRLSPIPVSDLACGAFDIDWFNRVHEILKDDHIDLLYDAAKYIVDGGSHTRVRKFVDASLGKLDIDETEALIMDKRNKDLLLAYPLIPMPRYKSGDKKGELKPEATSEMVRRYQFIQKFLKSSKQFGAQRQASEADCVKVALRNLATNAGYADVTRMTWQVESDLFEEMAHLFTTHEIDGYEVTLAIDPLGRTELSFKNDKGKTLKSMPSKLKKNELMIQIKEAQTEATEQWRRSRLSLELSMENEDIFELAELKNIANHPILRSLIENLVIGVVTTGDNVKGYEIEETGLFDVEKGALVGLKETKLTDKMRLLIAHPVHMHQNKTWSSWQHHLFDAEIKQPFKQVFRELYVPTKEELESVDSRRYAGHQIQPKVAAGALKKRHWVVDPEVGLQKIDFKRNVITTIYALADWFSPSDIEPPTIEYVSFFNRKTNEGTKLKDLSPVLFSESMRDVDLCVSVAHAGNVDPEASHSTIEMRRALLELTLPMLKLKNVKLTENHAIIEGSRANYTVHLGSGVVHEKGGSHIATLPVHSQTRGRIFLPFVDDDPKTSEVMSKIILFAEDQKIKDPSILSQITGHKVKKEKAEEKKTAAKKKTKKSSTKKEE